MHEIYTDSNNTHKQKNVYEKLPEKLFHNVLCPKKATMYRR